MLGRMEVPGGAAGADSERRVAADVGDHSEQTSPGRASASREVYILAAADAVEDALNSHRVLRVHSLPCILRVFFTCFDCPVPSVLSRPFWYSQVSRFPPGACLG